MNPSSQGSSDPRSTAMLLGYQMAISVHGSVMDAEKAKQIATLAAELTKILLEGVTPDPA